MTARPTPGEEAMDRQLEELRKLMKRGAAS